jgi:lipoprotein-anchoring transpeptidase ErfK/SrfK
VREDGGKAGFSTAILRSAIIVVPVLGLLALVLLLGGREKDDPVADVTPGIAAAPAPEAPAASPDRSNAATPDAAVPTAAPAPSADGGAGGRPADAGLAPAPAADAAPAADPTSARPAVRGGPIVAVRAGRRVEILDAPGGDLVARQGDETEFGSPSVFSVIRRTDRWIGVSTALLPNGEVGWIRADDAKLHAGYVDTAVVVDLSKRSAALFRGGAQVRSWPVTIGAAGSETPTGTFAVTDTFRGGLNPAYGCCAVALSATQPDVPSGWLGGNLIAFHGTGGALGVAASHGCLRSADRDVSALVDAVPLGTPVRIRG